MEDIRRCPKTEPEKGKKSLGKKTERRIAVSIDLIPKSFIASSIGREKDRRSIVRFRTFLMAVQVVFYLRTEISLYRTIATIEFDKHELTSKVTPRLQNALAVAIEE